MLTRVSALIVLYRMSAEASPAYCSLRETLEAIPAAQKSVSLTLFDNSPKLQSSPHGFEGAYLRDPSNPGLARPYNLALAAAQEAGTPWLLVLDQDTTVTPAYLEELLALIDGQQLPAQASAVIPKLVEGGIVQSPRLPPAIGRFPVLDAGLYGIAQERLHVYNSGTAFRVAALAAIGGFPEQFPLDYLDHATFHQLQARGDRLFVMHACLEHRLSGNQEDKHQDPAYHRRLQQIWQAEQRFYQSYGTPEERLLRRWRFIKCACKALKYADGRSCLLQFRYAFGS